MKEKQLLTNVFLVQEESYRLGKQKKIKYIKSITNVISWASLNSTSMDSSSQYPTA